LTDVLPIVVAERPVVYLRFVVGLAVAIDGIALWWTLDRLSSPAILQLPLLPLPRLTGEAVAAFMGAWFVSAVTFAVGRPRRLSGVVLFLLLAYIQLLDEQTYSNHGYLLTLVVGLTTVAHWSPSNGTVLAWPVFLLKTQLTVMYAFAAITKLNPAFMSGGVVYANLRPSIIDLGPPLISYTSISTLAWLSVATELFLAWALWSAEWRRIAMVVGVLFHCALVSFMADPTVVGLAVFSLTCWALYGLFLDDQDVDELIERGRHLARRFAVGGVT
jgi:hypothetical protein